MILVEVRIIGRIKTKDIKKAAFELINIYPDKFTSDFSKNKEILKELDMVPNKKMKNKIGGYITSIIKRKVS